MTNKQKDIVICSTENMIKEAKMYGILRTYDVSLYQILTEQLEYVKNVFDRKEIFRKLQETIEKFQYCSNDLTPYISSVLPDNPYYINGDGELIIPNDPIQPTPTVIASNFSTTNVVEEALFGTGPLYDMYKFNTQDFENAYSDNNDGDFFAIRIYRSNLNGMMLRFQSSPTTGSIWGEDPNFITIMKADIPKWSLYTDSISTYSHAISYSFIDIFNNAQLESNVATLTVDRIDSGNQPPTVGDNTISAENRETLVLTLDDFTVHLSPPYNDPENDDIDAIMITELSTANKGKFYLNGVEVVTNQIITREDINAGLFVYQAPNIDSIWSDAFNFLARDEGSLMWVE